MAAADGHAKNHSIFLQPGDSYVMTPLYDILSMWPYFGDGPNQFNRRRAGLAMALRAKNVHYRLETIQARHWHQLAMKHGGPMVWDAMQALVERVEPALAAVESKLPRGFPGSQAAPGTPSRRGCGLKRSGWGECRGALNASPSAAERRDTTEFESKTQGAFEQACS